jgi:hypothetical protein
MSRVFWLSQPVIEAASSAASSNSSRPGAAPYGMSGTSPPTPPQARNRETISTTAETTAMI